MSNTTQVPDVGDDRMNDTGIMFGMIGTSFFLLSVLICAFRIKTKRPPILRRDPMPQNEEFSDEVICPNSKLSAIVKFGRKTKKLGLTPERFPATDRNYQSIFRAKLHG
jgi:hypothetical protein